MEENINAAIEYYEKAEKILNLKEAYPVKAYFEAVKGNQKEALSYLNAYANKEKRSFGYSLMV